MKKWQIAVIIVLVGVLGAGVGAYAATNFGTQSDPLVTVSYIEDTLESTMTAEFDAQVSAVMERLEQEFENEIAGATGTYEVVSMTSGMSLVGSAGCEILYRSGAVTAMGALVDVSGGTVLADGSALTENHLYICGNSDDGINATSDTTILVRGSYTLS